MALVCTTRRCECVASHIVDLTETQANGFFLVGSTSLTPASTSFPLGERETRSVAPLEISTPSYMTPRSAYQNPKLYDGNFSLHQLSTHPQDTKARSISSGQSTFSSHASLSDASSYLGMRESSPAMSTDLSFISPVACLSDDNGLSHALGAIGPPVPPGQGISQAAHRDVRGYRPIKLPKDQVKWQCTLCDLRDFFRTEGEWKKHELAHFPQVVHICFPRGLKERTASHRTVCAACDFPNPDGNHLDSHNPAPCIEKTLEARVEKRKDRFIKHLASHAIGNNSSKIAEWSLQPFGRIWGCGFCVRAFDDFEERSFHVGKHFKQGFEMGHWSTSTIIQSLLTQPSILPAWNSLVAAKFGSRILPSPSWPSDRCDSLQNSLEEQVGPPSRLAKMAFVLSSYGPLPPNPQEPQDASSTPLSDLSLHGEEHPSTLMTEQDFEDQFSQGGPYGNAVTQNNNWNRDPF